MQSLVFNNTDVYRMYWSFSAQAYRSILTIFTANFLFSLKLIIKAFWHHLFGRAFGNAHCWFWLNLTEIWSYWQNDCYEEIQWIPKTHSAEVDHHGPTLWILVSLVSRSSTAWFQSDCKVNSPSKCHVNSSDSSQSTWRGSSAKNENSVMVYSCLILVQNTVLLFCERSMS